MASACALSACGGGAHTGSGSPGLQTAAVGMASAIYSGNPKPLITASSGSVTVSALSGATFSSVIVTPAPTYANTYFALSRNTGGVDEVFTLPYGGSQEVPLTHSVNGCNDPAISKNGWIYYGQLLGLDPYVTRADGTSTSAISTKAAYFLYPSVSPDDTKLAFDAGGGELDYVPTGANETATVLATNVEAFGTSWAPTSKSIAYVGFTSAGYDNIETVPVTGGTPTDVTPLSLVNTGNWFFPSWSSDGISIAAEYQANGTSTNSIYVMGTNTTAYIDLTPSKDNDSYPCFSPDGTHIAFYRSNANGAVPGIYVASYNGQDTKLLYADPSGDSVIDSLCWSPYPVAQTLLGTTSNLANEAVSGFLIGQNGSQFGGILGFVAKTPSAATITSPSITSSGQPLVFTLGADAITSIEYANDFYSYKGESTITPPASTPSALVTVDASTGQIDTVATAYDPALATPTRGAADTLTYHARFSALYDGKGHNLAPQGASQVIVDPKTGKLVSFQ